MKTQQKNLQEMSDAELAARREHLHWNPTPRWHRFHGVPLVDSVAGMIVGGIVLACGGGPLILAVSAAIFAGAAAFAGYSCRYHLASRREESSIREELARREEERLERQQKSSLAPKAANDSLPAAGQIAPSFDNAAASTVESPGQNARSSDVPQTPKIDGRQDVFRR
jgi:predicted lipid-binding transport protein (Tim44 family)